MVMIHHYSQYVVSNNISTSLFYKLFSTQGGYLGVALFFFLSGFGLMESDRKKHLSIGPFLRKRMLKIYLPVILISFIWYFACRIFLPFNPFGNTHLTFPEASFNYIISIFFNFGDEVLWFIKIILILYVNFFLFSFIRRFNEVLSFIYLLAFTLLITYFQAVSFSLYSSISIPFFTLGVLISFNKNNPSRLVYASSLFLGGLIVLSLIFLDKALCIHSLFNIMAIGFLIFLFSFKEINFKIPSILGLISFDIYLVHNKVLMTMIHYSSTLSLISFFVITTILSLTFYGFRTLIFNKDKKSLRIA